MKAIRYVPIWLLCVGCFALGVVNRQYRYNDQSDDRVEGWQYYPATVSDWFLLGMAMFWLQLAIWCFVRSSRAECRPISFVAGVLLTGVATLYMCLYFAPEYLFH